MPPEAGVGVVSSWQPTKNGKEIAAAMAVTPRDSRRALMIIDYLEPGRRRRTGFVHQKKRSRAKSAAEAVPLPR
jgi:hypothetical protein